MKSEEIEDSQFSNKKRKRSTSIKKESRSEGKSRDKSESHEQTIIITKEVETCSFIFKSICKILELKEVDEKLEQQNVLFILIKKELPSKEDQYWDSSKQIIIHQFGTEMSAQRFIIYLCLILKYKYYNSKDIKQYNSLQPLFPYFVNREMKKYSFICFHHLQCVMMKDILLSYLLFNDGYSLLKLLATDYYIPVEIPVDLETPNFFYKNNIIVNKDFLTSIATSPLCLNEYHSLLDKEGVKISKENLSKQIKQIIPELKIYQYLLPLSNYGLTLYNGYIVVHNKMIIDIIDNINASALFVGTFLHELLHYLKRALNTSNTNYYNNTINGDIGTKFDYFLYGEKTFYYNSLSLFLLSKKTYQMSEKEYKEELQRISKKTSNQQKHNEKYGIEGYSVEMEMTICGKHSKKKDTKITKNKRHKK